MKERIWWWLFMAVSAALVVVLVRLWWLMNRYEIEPTQLVTAKAVDECLAENWKGLKDGGGAVSSPLTKIPTGIFIQSLKFFDSTEVNLTGYIWQRYTDGVNEAFKPEPGVIGFILPEQVQTGSDIDPREVYRIR